MLSKKYTQMYIPGVKLYIWKVLINLFVDSTFLEASSEILFLSTLLYTR